MTVEEMRRKAFVYCEIESLIHNNLGMWDSDEERGDAKVIARELWGWGAGLVLEADAKEIMDNLLAKQKAKGKGE